MKKCSRCDEYKEITFYTKHKYAKDGLRSSCKGCEKIYRDSIKERAKDYVVKNKDKISKYQKEYRKTNITQIRKHNREYQAANKERIRQRIIKDNNHSIKKYQKNNPHILQANNAKRRALKRNATPLWLTKEQLQEIRSFYKEKIRLEMLDGIKRHVDHIIPINNNLVCGLHVPWNLQILTAEENVRKSNKLIID